ncbi:hypothetical protein IW152_005996 [Coemansia sp. BCRC 34962]|nr:hypothetical protein IW152_005996 [Coemansia sp. BCRC 34962]
MSGVSRRYPSLVQLATLVEELMDVLKDGMKRLSKGGVSGDQQILEELSGKLRALDMLSLLETLQAEISHEAALGDTDRRVPMPESNDSSQTIELDALGLRDRQVVAQALDIVMLFEVLPRLSPGIGVPVAQRSGSRPEAVDILVRLQQRVPETWDTSQRGSVRAVDLGQIVSRLVGILGHGRTAGDVAAVLAAKHMPDLLAALLQVAYAPIPPQGAPADLRYYVERDAERRVELRRAFTRVFDETSPYLLFESLTSLLNAAVATQKQPSSGGPRWFRTLCGRFLSRVLMRPNGARIAADFLVGNDSELTTDKLHRISNLLLTAPAATPPGDYYQLVLPQVLRMAEIYYGGNLQASDSKGKAVASSPEQTLVDDIMDTQAVNARIVQAAVYALCRLADKDRAAFSTYVSGPVLAPLMRCFDNRSPLPNPTPFVDAGDNIGISLVPPSLGKPARRPLIEVLGSENEDCLPVSAVSTAAELAAALDGIRRLILDGGVPSAAVLAELVVPVFAPLLRWHSFELSRKGEAAAMIRDILVTTLYHLPRSAAISTVINVAQTVFGPSDDNSGGGDWPVFVRDNDSGLATLVWKSKAHLDADGSEESVQQFVPAEALLDVLGSDRLRDIIGDIFMTFLREQEALLDLLRSGDSGSTMADGLPRKWWLVSQTTVAMVDRFGPAVLAKHTDVLAFVLNTMQRWIQSAGSSAPLDSATPDVSIDELLKSLTTKDAESVGSNYLNDDMGDKAEGVLGETEMLLTALMLLGQIMESSQQSAFASLASSIDPKSTAPVADSSMPAIEWGEDALRLLRRIYTQITQICTQQWVPMVAKMAGEVKLQVALVLALHSEAPGKDQSAKSGAGTEEDSEVVRFNAAVRDVHDDLVPVQAHGIIELRNMVLSKSPALNNTDRMDATIAVFTDMVKCADSYIYLNAIRGLSSLADAHGRRFVPALAEMYVKDGVSLEERLRVGEALLQSVQRAGLMLADYADDLVPRLVTAIHPAANVSLVEESSEGVVCVHSALSILSAVAQACPLALQKWIAEIASTLDGLLLLSDNVAAPVLRRAAVVFWVSLLRGYGDRLLKLVDMHILRAAYRSLRRVGESDSDEMTRLHALVGIGELDDLMKGQLASISSNIL